MSSDGATICLNKSFIVDTDHKFDTPPSSNRSVHNEEKTEKQDLDIGDCTPQTPQDTDISIFNTISKIVNPPAKVIHYSINFYFKT